MAKLDICVFNGSASPLAQIQVAHSASPEIEYRLPTTTYLANGKLISEVVGGGSPAANASAFELDTESDYSNTGDRHVVLKNNGTEFGSIYKNPGNNRLIVAGPPTAFSYLTLRPEDNSSYDLSITQFAGLVTFAGSATGGIAYSSGKSNTASGSAFFFKSTNTLSSGANLAIFQNSSSNVLTIQDGGAIASEEGLGLHGVTPPAQSAAGTTAADAIACLKAHGLMAT